MKEVDRMHSKGRPVLVGTTSVEQSESLAAQLREQGRPHRILDPFQRPYTHAYHCLDSPSPRCLELCLTDPVNGEDEGVKVG